MNVHDVQAVHLVGAGGINMSAVGKLLLASGVRVSGSDAVENEQTRALASKGAKIMIGQSVKNVPADADLVVYTSAAPENNPEREEARRRSIPELTNFQFLGEWFKTKKMIVVAGTHGKSTTTAMLGLALEQADLDPTVVVGSKVPSFPDGNLRIGSSEFFVVEGDEYAKHFLDLDPYGLLLTNLEWDHTDIFPSLEDMVHAFRELIGKVRFGGVLIANIGDPNVARLLEQERMALETLKLRVIRFNGTDTDDWHVTPSRVDGTTHVELERQGTTYRFALGVPGTFNAMNAAGAALMALELGAPYPTIARALADFHGIWRRFESLGEKGGVRIISDYGHHPTAVAATLSAAHEIHPEARIVLCFQPHHHNRTKHLFLDFVPSFDAADALILCEIYDVAGRDADEDAGISSKDLVDAVQRHDADRGVVRDVEYASDPDAAVKRSFEIAHAGDVLIVMGAGDIDDAIRKIL